MSVMKNRFFQAVLFGFLVLFPMGTSLLAEIKPAISSGPQPQIEKVYAFYSRFVTKFPIWAALKLPGLIDRKRPNISNMWSFTIDQSRFFRAAQMKNFVTNRLYYGPRWHRPDYRPYWYHHYYQYHYYPYWQHRCFYTWTNSGYSYVCR